MSRLTLFAKLCITGFILFIAFTVCVVIKLAIKFIAW